MHEDIAQSNARLKRLLDSENQAENEENPFIKQRLKVLTFGLFHGTCQCA